jgi:hypothetical protein
VVYKVAHCFRSGTKPNQIGWVRNLSLSILLRWEVRAEISRRLAVATCDASVSVNRVHFDSEGDLLQPIDLHLFPPSHELGDLWQVEQFGELKDHIGIHYISQLTVS